jgi:ferredoxin
MAIKITDECINCGACEPECPNNAIYEGGVEWAVADGTTVKGSFTLLDGTSVDAAQRIAPKIPPKLYAVKPMPDMAGDRPSVANMVGSQLYAE